jgi:hypothetical protein
MVRTEGSRGWNIFGKLKPEVVRLMLVDNSWSAEVHLTILDDKVSSSNYLSCGVIWVTTSETESQIQLQQYFNVFHSCLRQTLIFWNSSSTQRRDNMISYQGVPQHLVETVHLVDIVRHKPLSRDTISVPILLLLT